MFVRIVFVIEIITIVACIHAFYSKKSKFTFHTMLLVLLLLLVCEVMNVFQIEEITSLANYFFIYLYCKIEYKESYIKTGISVLLIFICIVILQFMCLLVTQFIIPDNAIIRTILINIETLCLAILVLPRLSVNELRENIQWKNRYIRVILGFIGIVIAVLLIHDKVQKKILAEGFVFSIPAIAVILWLIGQWSSLHIVIDKLEQERNINSIFNDKYQELLLNVRMRQHEFKNHIAALFSTHYTYKTYDKLVAAQKDYCDKLLNENRYNTLLLIDNNILAAFLYEKFRQIEMDGITLEYSIKAKINDCSLSAYYLVEMLGILLDNAVEAVKGIDAEKEIAVSIIDIGAAYQFIICNKHDYIPYDQIIQWFRLENTSKGFGRGLGLYHIKKMCEECKCDIKCQNFNKDGANWIQFVLEVKKADNH